MIKSFATKVTGVSLEADEATFAIYPERTVACWAAMGFDYSVGLIREAFARQDLR